MHDSGERRAFRRTAVRLWLTAAASALFLVAVSGLIALGDGSQQRTVPPRLVLAPIAALTLWFTVGVFRQGVWTNAEGITVRNVFRRYFARWSDVAGIEPPPAYGTMRHAGLQIVLTDGTRINAALFAAGPFSRSSHSDAVVEALRSALERHSRT